MSWMQKEGQLPYDEWAELKTSDIYPGKVWVQQEGDLPYKLWHERVTSDIHPDKLWVQKEGSLPYKNWKPLYVKPLPPIPEPELPVIEKYEVDWTAGMKQSFEYYKVDPTTWYDVEELKMVRRGNITRDIESDTLGSASVSVSELFDECYVRIYLVVEQNGYTHREPLGTYLMSSPSMNFNGTSYTIDISAYTPLMELKENNPPLGYYTKKNTGVIEAVCDLVSEHCRAPMSDSIELYKEMEDISEGFEDVKLNANFIANYEDSWFNYISDLLSKSSYRFNIDPYGKISLTKAQEILKMQPKWIFTDDDNSILYTDVSIDRDIFGIPNVVEVINSRSLLGGHAITVENNDPNSPVSIQRRGRRIVHRVYNPSGLQGDDQKSIERYATKLLKQLSALQITISYQHGYCPVTIGDCVMINYRKAGLENIKAIITSQSISCTPGCQVSEKAVYTEYLWGGNT